MIMHTIQANASGTRNIEINDAHLETLKKYALFSNLVGSSGIIDEDTLDRLKLNVRSLLESEAGKDKALLDLCLDVIYNQNMKALGLKNLIALYKDWKKEQQKVETDSDENKPEV